MHRKIMIALLLVILLVLNYGIYEKERIKKNGEILLLELAPLDPRSLMQGDYMRLSYDIANQISPKELEHQLKRGYIVIKADENNIAQFVRFYKNEKLIFGERLLRFHKIYRRIKIIPDSFLFQEGKAELYEDAKYGVFKVDNSDSYLLIGLADKNRELIIP